MVGFEGLYTRKGPNFTQKEDAFLKKIITQDKKIWRVIMTRKCSKEALQAKDRVWKQVAAKFNTCCPSGTYRGLPNLKKRWTNMRFYAKKEGREDEFELDTSADGSGNDTFGGEETTTGLEGDEKATDEESDAPAQTEPETNHVKYQQEIQSLKRRSVENHETTLKRIKFEKKERNESDDLRGLLKEKVELEVKLLQKKIQAMDKINTLLDKKLSPNNRTQIETQNETPAFSINILDL